MDSSLALKYHIRTFRIVGLWPDSQDIKSPLYTSWTLLVFLVTGFLFPISLIMNLFFAETMSEIVDFLVITSSVIVVAIKGINLYTKRKQLDELFQILRKLDDSITEESYINHLNKAIRNTHRFFFIYFYLFMSTCGFLVLQAIFSAPEKRLWTSTYEYPYEWAHYQSIYVGGLFYHGFANTCIVFFASSGDTYGVVLMYMLSKHIDILNERLKKLGNGTEPMDDLIKCCRIYEKIIRCAELLNSIVTVAMFAQFGVSGVVLCTSAYQLTSNSFDDVTKLGFVIFYFLSMLTEVFVPCYFGSYALAKSDLITRCIYESRWIGQSKKYGLAFRIFVERTLRPLQFYAGGLFLLDLGSFLRILKTAYSLFALLKNV